jgi:hypothetical protein
MPTFIEDPEQKQAGVITWQPGGRATSNHSIAVRKQTLSHHRGAPRNHRCICGQCSYDPVTDTLLSSLLTGRACRAYRATSETSQLLHS